MDPISLIMGGVQGLGGLFHGITGFLSSGAQARADENASVQAGSEAGVNASEKLMEGNAAAASGAVRAAANGGGLVGSSMGVIQNLSNQAYFNARTAVYRGLTTENADLYQAKVARSQGLSDLIGGAVGATGSVLGGMMRSSLMGQIQQSSNFGVTVPDAPSMADLGFG